MKSRMARALALAVVLLSIGEALMLHWALLALRGQGLAGAQWGLAILGVMALNAVVYPIARRSIRARGLRLVFSRGWIMGSVAALITGLVLSVVFLVVGGLATLAGGGALRDAALVWSGGLVIAIGFGATFWGATMGNWRVRVDHIPLKIDGLPQDRSLSVAHITDLHIGPLLETSRLAAYIRRINALEPDLVVITGDIFDFDPAYVEDGCRELAKLEARHGVFAVLGNHDHYTGLDVVVRGLRDLTPIRLLRDEWVSIALDGGGEFALAGLEDPGEGWMERESQSEELAQLATGLPSELASVLLVHRPSFFAQAERLGFPLVLSGHTHGGQVALPVAQNLNPSRLIADLTRGLFTVGGSQLYVSRGLGMAGLPLRINCPREIALLQLRG